jgi:hypothetical protein
MNGNEAAAPLSAEEITELREQVADQRGMKSASPFAMRQMQVKFSCPLEYVDRVLATIERLQTALDESVKLQSHYATLLNGYDGGERRGFGDGEAWIARLRETGKIQ